MRQVQNEKHYYKMYKKGRFWIFAGIAVATINMGALTSQADAVTAVKETSSTSTNSESEISQSQVVLRQPDSSVVNSGSDSSTSATNTDTAVTQAKSSTATGEQDQNETVVKSGGSANQTVSSSRHSQAESSSDSQASSEQSKTNEIVNGTKETVASSDEQSVTETPITPATTPDITDEAPKNTPKSSPATLVESEAASKESIISVNTIGTVDSVSDPDIEAQLTKHQSVTKLNLLTSNVFGAAAVQENKLSRASLMKAADVTVLASGTWGTSPWKVTSDGLLTIGSGTFGTDSMAPWEGNNYLPDMTRVRAVISKVVIDKNVVAGHYLSYLFFKKNTDPGYVPLTEIDGLENIDVSHATEMYGVFSGDQVSDLSGIKDWDTSNVTEMSAMFSSNPITDSSKLPVGNWNVGKVQSFNSMFSNMPIKSLDLSHWNVGADGQKITFGGMFLVDPQLKSLNISGWNMSNATQFANLFSNNTALSSLTVSEQTRFGTDSDLPSVPTAEKTWQSTTGGDKYTSAELMSLYSNTSSNIPTGTITYVWEPASKSNFEVGPITVIAGPKSTWSAKDNVTSLVDGEGKKVDLSSANINNLVKVVSVNGNQYNDTVNVRTTGQNDQVVNAVVLAYTDSYGAVRQETTTVTVVKSQARLVGQNVSVNMGPKPNWQVSDAVDRTASLNAVGDTLPDAEVATVTATGLDLTKAGAQKVTLTYVDQYGNTVSTTVTVTMVASQADFKSRDVTIVAGDLAKWSWQDSVASATDFAGVPVATDALAKLSIVADKQPDLQTPGDYPITLTYTDSDGNVVTHIVQVKVVENKATIQTQPIQIIAGPSAQVDLKAALTKLTAVDGTDVAFENAKLTTNTDQLDLNTVGKQTAMVTYQDEAGYVHTAEIEITLVPSKAALTSKNSTIFIGPKTPAWTAAMNLTSAKDSDGHDLAIDAVTVDGNVDIKTAGDYSVNYSYTDSAGNVKEVTAVVTVKASAAGVVAKNTDLIAGPNTKWAATDNFVSATDARGEKVEFNDVKVTGEVDASKTGDYSITYSYTDSAGNVKQATAVVTVKASVAGVVAKNTDLIVGPNTKWTATDNFVSATDAKGEKVEFNDVKVTGEVDASKAGDYPITYSYIDSAGNTVSQTVTIAIKATQATIKATDATVIAGPGAVWTPETNFVSAQDATGQKLTFDQVKVAGAVDLHTPGHYAVTYQYTDVAGNLITAPIMVKVVATQATLKVKDTAVIAGKGTWTPADNFVSATDAAGESLTVDQIKVDGQVDLQTPGTYQVTYRYLDSARNQQTQTVTIDVAKTRSGLVVKDSQLVAGPKTDWQPADNFVSATDAIGKPLNVTDLKVTGSVDPTKPGDYKVTYTYTDAYGNEVAKTITVSVIASQLSLDAKNAPIIAGPESTWNAKDNFVNATDAAGKTISLADVTVTGTVNPNQAGDYKVTYTYTDAFGNEVTQTITVKVVTSQVALKVKDSQLKVGAKWQASDNLVLATNATGQALTVDDLIVTGMVETAQAGAYKVTYQYTDAAGNVATATAMITVTADAEQPGSGDQVNAGDENNGNNNGDSGLINENNGNNNGDGDLINEGNGNGHQIDGGYPLNLSNSGRQTSVAGDRIVSSQPSLKQPTTTRKSTRSLPQANEKQTASWVALAGVGLMAMLATVGYRRKH
ncbi:bacterial Ig-like domain-containing protein [Lactiplantibacillus xiangfangensis]|uniref:Cell surface protein n=1 Tax=Lactiplantibacillus xiangfangensis TaxID=942150 RepID=A0A0R2M3V0_9LACO|nr:bacterial Ig-like domain-containing protein [Lactiplantibacillus xiangfangensis]KRO08517.1 cell surface protein [Lactiplantibacillus xiangfangensis]